MQATFEERLVALLDAESPEGGSASPPARPSWKVAFVSGILVGIAVGTLVCAPQSHMKMPSFKKPAPWKE